MNKLLKFLVLSLWPLLIQANNVSIYEKYFINTYQGMERMRNQETRLIRDSVNAELRTINDATSPSNIGLDLLVQLEAKQWSKLRTVAAHNVTEMLNTLNNLSYHTPTGLFFARYSSNGKEVRDFYLSSIDNFHLAVGLWLITQNYPESKEREIASALFKRMNLNFFYDSSTGLAYGGASYRQGKWILDSWKYDYLGSEGRSMYGLGWAIGIFNDEELPIKVVEHLKIEMQGNMLKLWDGGAFQLLLPRLLVNEEKYSNVLKAMFSTYANFILEEGSALDFPVPAAFSACQVSMDKYNGKAGSPQLVSSSNNDFLIYSLRRHWDEVFTPHAAFLAAPFMPDKFAQKFKAAEDIGAVTKLYQNGAGWLDGLHVKGERKGEIVSVYLSLDQAMIALASAQILSQTTQTKASSIIKQNALVERRLKYFYALLERKLNSLISYQ